MYMNEIYFIHINSIIRIYIGLYIGIDPFPK
jgi:hypothetical protein